MYETFLRKQILDHSSKNKCYIETVLGSLAAFVGMACCVLTHTPRLPQSFSESWWCHTDNLQRQTPWLLCAAREGKDEQ